MATAHRTLLAAFLSGNIVEAHKAASPAHLERMDNLQLWKADPLRQWHETASEHERTRSGWALTMIAASDTRNRQRAVTKAGNAAYAEKLATQADSLDKRADAELSAAISAGAFDNWPMPLAA